MQGHVYKGQTNILDLVFTSEENMIENSVVGENFGRLQAIVKLLDGICWYLKNCIEILKAIVLALARIAGFRFKTIIYEFEETLTPFEETLTLTLTSHFIIHKMSSLIMIYSET